jgi:hypothetical protein
LQGIRKVGKIWRARPPKRSNCGYPCEQLVAATAMDVASHAIDPPEPRPEQEAGRSASKTHGRLFEEKSPDKFGNDGDENLGLDHLLIVALTAQIVKAGKPGSSIALGRGS